MKHLVYAKDNDSDYEFLSTVIKNKRESTELLETYSRLGMTVLMVPVPQFFEDCKSIDDKICKVLRELKVDEEGYERTGKDFKVKILGDWKHVHAHCNNVLTRLFGCTVVDEKTTWEDGSDYYESIHTYCLNKK